jgi:hypothetical protein
MTRSKRHPIFVISPKIDKDQAHKTVRHFIKSELNKKENADECKIEFDTRDLGEEEWGTKIEPYTPEQVKKASRK